MRKFKNATETLDALEEILVERRAACGERWDYLATNTVIALYRLAEVQLALWARVGGTIDSPCSYKDYEEQLLRFAKHENSLGIWITEQPE